ncbi:LacI family DNA-binding transcriptional regulator [Aquipuribacter sp. MA13-6]|uniref:LacI family DNA-binding transcriptional regulator n=1 Tax=unclassified Aquipuribacter TaxID=2635084 RepID=UPI003EEC69E1
MTTPEPPPGRKGSRVTIFDVAVAAGVSYSTVSRVVNGQRHIAVATRARVERAMAELGYVADLRARSLAGGSTTILGLLLLDINSDYMVEIVRAVDDEVSRSGYDLMLCTTHSRTGDPGDYVRRLAPGLVDGLMVLVPQDNDRYLQVLRASGFPHVLIDHHGSPEGSSVVRATNDQGIRDAVRHLAGLGHTRITHLRGDEGQDTTRIREAAFRSECERLGVRATVAPGGFNEVVGHPAALAVLDVPDGDGGTAGVRPTAILAANDAAALGVLSAARSLGLRVPEDVSVVGFDDVTSARLTSPRLTTVRQPLASMGRVATELLLSQLGAEPSEPRLVELPTELVVRESSGPPPAGTGPRHGSAPPPAV